MSNQNPIQFHSTQLANGLTIIGEVNPKSVSAALGFFVRTGARDESADVAGVSHFLEHMMFKGTAKRTALDIGFDFGAIGAQSNAYTSEENTVYYAAVLPEYFSEAFEILSDMLRPTLDVGEFTTEKNVILEEIALYQDRPHFVLFESALKAHFGEHPAGNSVLGSTASVGGLPVEKMREYFARRYSPSNMVLVAAGNYDWPSFVAAAEAATKDWKVYTCSRDTRPHQPVGKSHTIYKEDLQVAHACLVANGPSARDEERFAAHILACIIGDHSGSKAYWELIDKGLAESASIDIDEMDGTGAILGYVSSEPERLDEVTAILTRIMEQALDFTDEDLERAKTKTATRIVLSGESSMRRLMSIGNDWIYREEYLPLDEELAKIKAVGRNEIERLAAKYPFKPSTVVKLLPGTPRH